MTDLSSEQVLGTLAKQIKVTKPIGNAIPIAYMRFATINSVASTTAVFTFAGSTVPQTARFLYGASFIASDTVALIQYKIDGEETQYLILGKLA